MPYFLDPGQTQQFASTTAAGSVSLGPYFAAGSASWAVALADRYYQGDPYAEHFYSAESVRVGQRLAFHYSCSLFAHSRFWNQTTREGTNQYGATSISVTAFPSHKVVIFDVFSQLRHGDFSEQTNVSRKYAAADGHVDAIKTHEIRPGIVTGDGLFPGSFHLIDFIRGSHTVDGVRGRDLP